MDRESDREDLPEEVKRLVARHITSVEQLEILLLVRARPDVEWTAEMASAEIRTSEASAAHRLEHLGAASFLAPGRSPGSWVYAPATPALRDAVEGLVAAYAERRFTVIDLIFSKPIDKLRVYADAFRFRREKDDPDG